MENQQVLSLTPADHPNLRVRQVGFELTDPYVEQCWGAIVGPSATMLLRRMPALWVERIPATITRSELGASVGLGSGSGPNSRLMSSVDRVVRFGLASWHEEGRSLDVYVQVAGLSARQVERLPEWNQRAHLRLLGAHAERLAERAETGPRVAAMSARLDRLQRARGLGPVSPAPSPVVER